MQLTKGAIGNLINRYKAVLKKCHLLNVFGSLAVAGMLVMGGLRPRGRLSSILQAFMIILERIFHILRVVMLLLRMVQIRVIIHKLI